MQNPKRHARTFQVTALAASLAALLLPGCGAGTASAAAAASGGSSGSGTANAKTIGTDLRIVDTEDPTRSRPGSSPASISFLLTDQEGDPADVVISYSLDGGPYHEIRLAMGSASTHNVPSGELYTVLWNFAYDLGPGYWDGLCLRLRVVGGISPGPLCGIAVGNDAPTMTAIPLANQEYAGSIDVGFVAADSASDPVDIKVEFNTDPPGAWRLARPAGTSSMGLTPQFAFEGFPTTPSGQSGAFVWNSTFNLMGVDTQVLIRFTARDEFTTGPSVVTPAFHVDNNAAPRVVLDEANFVLNSDARRGIPLRFSAIDEEADPLRWIVQWTYQGEDFLDLPGTVTELVQLLEPEADFERRQLRVGSQRPAAFRGQVGMADLPGNRVRLPELAGPAAGLVALGLGGRMLEILRASPRPEPQSWPGAPLQAPKAAVVIGDGRTALVLDEGALGWRVRELDLVTGVEVAGGFAAAGVGAPRAMAVHLPRVHASPSRQSGHSHVFVASSAELLRFALSDGTLEATIPNVSAAGPRFLAALGTDALLATEQEGLVRIGLSTSERESLLELDDPQGVVVDPLAEDRIYVAERGADRVVVVDLSTLDPLPLPAEVAPGDLAALGPRATPRPGALALERSGERLLVLTEEPQGTASLRGLHLRRPVGSGLTPRERPYVFEITDELGDASGALATGPDDLRIVVLSGANTLAVGGGVAQTRTVVSVNPYDPSEQTVTVVDPFEPPALPGARWRIRVPTVAAASSPVGTPNTVVWDSSEIIAGGEVLVRILPLDGDVGGQDVTSFAKTLRASLDVTPITLLSGTTEPVFVETVDIDGDGDLDLVSANPGIDALLVFSQMAPGQYEQLELRDPAIVGPVSVVAADLDEDGDMDLVSANADARNLTVLFQTAPGRFSSTLVLPHPAALTPRSVAVADLDGDGDVDIAAASNAGFMTGDVTVFFQTTPGQFDSPLVLEAPRARSVAVDDLDGDGDIDLVAGASNRVTVFFQSSGQFGTPGLVLVGESLDGDEFVTTADMDSDGDIDIVVANDGESDNVTILTQTAPGEFTVGAELRDTSLAGPDVVAAADLDGDGDIDLVVGSSNAGNATLFFQLGPGQFSDPPLVLDTEASAVRFVAVDDLDGDGDVDLCTASSGQTDDLKVFFQTGAGRFAEPRRVAQASGDAPRAVAVADLDRDGDMDLVSANAALDDNLTLLFQTGPGQFTETSVLVEAILTGPRSVTAADIDLDGDLDLAVASAFQDSITWFRQSPAGVFNVAATLSHPTFVARPISIALADLDRDGRPDIVSANPDTHNLTIFHQTTLGEFDPIPERVEDPRASDPQFVAAADLDGNGHVDLVVVNSDFSSGNLAVFLQTDTGFGTPIVLEHPRSFAPRSAAVADLDGDGDLDLVSTHTGSSGSEVAIFFQVRSAEFGEPEVITHPGLAAARAVAAGDVDGDGDLDLAVANQNQSVVLFIQDDPGQFRPGRQLGGISAGGIVTLADVDGDGDADVVSVASPDLAVFYGAH